MSKSVYAPREMAVSYDINPDILRRYGGVVDIDEYDAALNDADKYKEFMARAHAARNAQARAENAIEAMKSTDVCYIKDLKAMLKTEHRAVQASLFHSAARFIQAFADMDVSLDCDSRNLNEVKLAKRMMEAAL